MILESSICPKTCVNLRKYTLAGISEFDNRYPLKTNNYLEVKTSFTCQNPFTAQLPRHHRQHQAQQNHQQVGQKHFRDINCPVFGFNGHTYVHNNQSFC